MASARDEPRDLSPENDPHHATPRDPPSLSGRSRSTPIQNTTVVIMVLLFFCLLLENTGYHSMQTSLIMITERTVVNNRSVSHYIGWYFSSVRFLPLLGAVIGENFLGEYGGSLVGLVLELVGSLLFLIWIPTLIGGYKDYELNFTTVVVALTLVCIGRAFTRTNILVLACKQLPDDRIADTSCFLWYYWATYIGILLGYILQGTKNHLLIVCLWPSTYFIALVLAAVVWKVPLFVKDNPSERTSRIVLESLFFTCIAGRQVSSITQDPEIIAIIAQKRNDQRRLARHFYSLCIITAIHIVFHAVYNIDSVWLSLLVGRHKQAVYLASHNLAWVVLSSDYATIFFMAPVTYFIILPVIRRVFPCCRDQLKLIGVGMVLLALSCTVAGIDQFIDDESGDETYPAIRPLKVIQYIIMALAELFTLVVTHEFLYLESPKGIRQSMIGLYFSSNGLGVILSRSLDYGFAAFPSSNKRESFGYFLLILACAQMVMTILYGLYITDYKYKTDHSDELERIFEEPELVADTYTRRMNRLHIDLSDSDSD